MTCFNIKATPIIDNDYSYHITAIELFSQSYGVHMTQHRATIVINSLGWAHTQTHTLTGVCTETIVGNQVR